MATEVLVPMVASHEFVSDVAAPIVVTSETISKAASEPVIVVSSSATSEPDVAIVVGLGTGAIHSPPVMMPGLATPPCSPTTGLVSSRKFILDILVSAFFCFHPYVMGCISGVDSPRLCSATDRSLLSKRVNYSGTNGHGGDDGGAASDMDTYEESYFAHVPDISKHSYLCPEKLETVVPKTVPPPAISTRFLGILLLCMALINDLHPVISLALI